VAAMGLPPGETASVRNSLRNEVNLMRQNQSALEAEQEAADKAALAAREAAADEADRRVTDALLEDLPREEVMSRLSIARNLVSPERYLTLSNKVMDPNESQPMSAGIYASFLSAADRGELTDEQIWNLPGSPEQLKTLIDRSGAWQDDGLRAGKETINAYFAKADSLIGSFDPNDQSEGQLLKISQTEAHNELLSWIEDQTNDGKRPRRQEIVDEAQRISVRKGRVSGAAAGSKYIRVNAQGQIDRASVSEARDAIAADLKSGALSREQARQELARVKLAEEGLN